VKDFERSKERVGRFSEEQFNSRRDRKRSQRQSGKAAYNSRYRGAVWTPLTRDFHQRLSENLGAYLWMTKQADVETNDPKLACASQDRALERSDTILP
jgi:hypothetical protein